jgi:hypothetical protein
MIRLADTLWQDGRVSLRSPKRANIAYVCANMREADRREIFACRYDDDAMALAGEYEVLQPQSVAFYAAFHASHYLPIALFGAWETSPGVGQVHLIATDRWRKVAGPVTRFLKSVTIPSLIEAGWRRGECRALASNSQSRKWLYYLGAREETILPALGKNGEDFVQLSWSAPHVHVSEKV